MNERNGDLIRKIITLTVPALLEYSLQTLLSYADYIMVGKLGVNATASIGLTTEAGFLLKGSANAVGIGVLAYIAASIGAGKPEKAKAASVQAFYMAAAAGIATFAVAMAISPFLPVWLGADEEIIRSSSIYFAIISAPYLFFSFNAVLGNVLKAAGDMKTPLFVNGFANILNIILNFFLIYPGRVIMLSGSLIYVPGADLGVYGAGIATAAATVISGILMIVGVFRNKTVSPKGISREIDKTIIHECVRVGIPVMLTRLTSSSGRVLFTGLVARLGTVVYSAHTIAFTAESAFYIPCVGLMTAISTLAGNVKGERNINKLNRLTAISCAMAAGVMIIMGTALFLLSGNIIDLMTNDDQVKKIAPVLLKIVALNEPIFAVPIVMEGIYNGIGSTKLPFAANVAAQWTMRVAGTFICIYILGFGIKAAWVCMISDNILRCAILAAAYLLNRRRIISVRSENAKPDSIRQRA